MHRGIHRGRYHNVDLKTLIKYTLEGIYDTLTGQETEYISDDRIIWLENGGWMEIHTRDESEDLEELFS